jgi:hypothetical protein
MERNGQRSRLAMEAKLTLTLHFAVKVNLEELSQPAGLQVFEEASRESLERGLTELRVKFGIDGSRET